ncbi:MAG: response regulator [Bdellovibrionales bacterium]
MLKTNFIYEENNSLATPSRSLETPIPPKEFNRSANVLIIDDDVDSALLVESVFAHLGCQTTCSLSSDEARRRLNSLKADFIILDWCLDHQIEASQIISQCTQTFGKFDKKIGHGPRRKPKIITYSSLNEKEIEPLQSPYFQHIDHWQKPISHRELLSRVLHLLQKTGP